MNPEQQDSNQTLLLPVVEIRTNPYQPRRLFSDVALQELAASILEHGVLQPIIVRKADNGYQLISGERRLQATRRAGLTQIPAIVRDYSDRQALEVALVENLQREDISPVEAAEAYKRLMDEFGLTQEQVALRVGKSRPAVANTLRLLKLPDLIRNSLARGDISEGHARSLLAIGDPEWQQRVFQRIVQDSLSVRDTEALVYGSPEDREQDKDTPASTETVEPRTPAEKDPDIQALEGRLRLLTGTRVRIRGSVHRGSLVMEYYSSDDLERIVSLLGAV